MWVKMFFVQGGHKYEYPLAGARRSFEFFDQTRETKFAELVGVVRFLATWVMFVSVSM